MEINEVNEEGNNFPPDIAEPEYTMHNDKVCQHIGTQTKKKLYMYVQDFVESGSKHLKKN